MSWSFSATGQPDQIIGDSRTALNDMKCLEPEQTIKGMARDLIAEALEHYPEGQQVTLEAFGSQAGEPDEDGCAVNALSIKITPINAATAGLAEAS